MVNKLIQEWTKHHASEVYHHANESTKSPSQWGLPPCKWVNKATMQILKEQELQCKPRRKKKQHDGFALWSPCRRNGHTLIITQNNATAYPCRLTPKSAKLNLQSEAISFTSTDQATTKTESDKVDTLKLVQHSCKKMAWPCQANLSIPLKPAIIRRH